MNRGPGPSGSNKKAKKEKEQENVKMKTMKSLNLKNMKEAIVNYSGDQKEFDKIFDELYPKLIKRINFYERNRNSKNRI